MNFWCYSWLSVTQKMGDCRAIKEVRFNSSIGKEIYQDAFSDFNVKGRYLTSLPRTWGGEIDTCTTTSRLFKGLEYVTMSKQPTIMFDKAITTLKQDRRLPKRYLALYQSCWHLPWKQQCLLLIHCWWSAKVTMLMVTKLYYWYSNVVNAVHGSGYSI